MNSTTMTRQYKQHQGSEMIRECQGSGLTNAKWC